MIWESFLVHAEDILTEKDIISYGQSDLLNGLDDAM